MSIDLQKKISLVKEVLEQKNISDIQGQVVLALDISGSMDGMFRNGTVQDVVERLLAIGMNMDLDKQIDIHLFGANSYVAKSATLSNIDGYVQNEITKKFSLEGSTRYAGVIKDIASNVSAVTTETTPKKGLFSRLIGKTETKVKISGNGQVKEPIIVFFVTDGENFDQPETTELIKQLSNRGIFWQFIGIGSHRFEYLTHLDEMKGRYIDNANFFAANDISKISDEQLYDRILGELPEWIKEARAKGVII